MSSAYDSDTPDLTNVVVDNAALIRSMQGDVGDDVAGWIYLGVWITFW